MRKSKITNYKISYKSVMILLALSIIIHFGCSPKVIDNASSTEKITEKVTEEVKNMVEKVDTTLIPTEIVKIEDREFILTEPVPIDPNVRIGTFSNGMKYYIRANSKPENRMELRLAVNVGSLQEDENQKGLAHFIEHMAFNGTKNFAKNELVDYLESIGTKFGPDLNAYTGFDETVYMLQIPTDDAAIMDKGLLIMQDWATNVSFDEKEIDKERGVVLSEWRTGLGAQERMRNAWFPVVFSGSRYASRLPIGDPKIIENADYETIKAYYKKWYRPDLMSISVVGDFDINKMETKMTERFGKIAKPATPIDRGVYEVPDHKAPLIAIVKDKEATNTAIQVLYKHEHKEIKTVLDYREQLIYDMYNGMLNQRLDEKTREAKPPYIYAYSGYSNFVRSKDAYFAYALVADNGIENGLKALMEENQRVKIYGFTPNEYKRQKIELLKSVNNLYKEKDKTPSSRYVMNYVYNFLENAPITGVEYQKMLTEQLLETIDIQEVNKFGHIWLTKENRAIVVTMPDKAGVKVPNDNEIIEWLESFDNVKVEPYEEEPIIEEGLMGRPRVYNRLYGTRIIEEVGVTELSFPRGVKVILKPTNFQNDQVLMTGFRKGGTSHFEDEDYILARYADNMIKESGVSEYTASQLTKYLAQKQVSFYPYMSELYEGFSGSSTQADIEVMFQMMYLYFTEPAHDIDATAGFIERQKAQLANQEASPRFHFYDTYNKLLYQNNPRRKIITTADFKGFDTRLSALMFRERFRNANNFTFVIVGNFDVAVIKPLIEHYIGTVPTDKLDSKPAAFVDRNIEKVTGKVEEIVKKGQEPQSNVALQFHGDFDYNVKDAYDFSSMVEVLRIMLREEMREEQGGVYSVRVSPSISREPDTTYSVSVSFLCSPDDVDKLTKTVFEQIKKLQKQGPSSENLTKVQESQRRTREKNLKENGFWMSQIVNTYKYDSKLNEINLFGDAYIEQIDAAGLQEAAKKYFTEQYIKVVLMPEN